MPPDDDHYAAGLWSRAIGRMDNASVAFRMELDAPTGPPRYAPGDIECQLSETIYSLDQPETRPDALHESRQSYAARLPNDSLGRAWSRISEARIRMTMVFSPEDSQVNRARSRISKARIRMRTAFGRHDSQANDEDVTPRIKVLPEHLAALDEIADLLRKAQSEAGGQSAEDRSQAAALWSHILLARGDLTSAISYFEEAAEIMIALEERTIWSHYWPFALNLVQQGWIARGYETAVNAFQFAMQTGDIALATKIREFCQRLEATYPELVS